MTGPTGPVAPAGPAVVPGTPAPPRLPGYRVHRVLGVGSTATVWSATAPDGSDVALKVVPVHQTPAQADTGAVGREVEALRAVDHPGVVRLREVVVFEGAVVLVLDRAAGGSLGALVRARGSLEVGEVLRLLTDLAGVLADLHAIGLVHGDVSPGNVVFDAAGTAMLTDLGLARVVDHLGAVGGAGVGGTPGFADPAATEAGPLPAGDVHGLAAVAWYALTGVVPGPAGGRVPLPLLVPDVGADLAQALEAATSPVPAHRPDAAQLGRVAAASGSGDAVHLVPSDPGAPSAELLTHRLRAAAVAAQVQEAAPRRRLLRPVLVVVSTLAVLGGAWLVSGRLLHPGEGAASTASSTPTSSAASPAPSRTPRARATTAPPPRSRAGRTSAGAADEPATPVPTPVAVPAADLLADPRAGITALATARAQAYTAADASLLAAVDVPGSEAERRDAAVVRSLLTSGARVRGLAFDVRSAEVVKADPGAGSATVRTTVVTTAHEQVVGDGSVQQVPASEPVTSLLLLQREDRADGQPRWRVASTG